MDQQTLALIVAPPGVLRQSLRATVVALHRLETIDEADTITQAILMNHDPALVLFSVEGPEIKHLAAIRMIKTRWPAARCIALVDTVAQKQPAREEGAEAVLVKGVRPAELLSKIERLVEEDRYPQPESLEMWDQRIV
jgi:DNA-binding NarL/FixJ family response regulator